MATIKAATLAAEMEDVLKVCPPYVSPGTTSYTEIMRGTGCDCSGVPYAIFKSHGLSLYHGSNTIARKYADGLTSLSGASQLEVGMAVYKWSASGSEPEKYRSDGLGDFHHIGIVTSISPLRIVHQSSAAGCTACDTTIKKWSYCSRLKGVDYDSTATQESKETNGGDSMYNVKVVPKSLRIRADASTKSTILGSLPCGTVVDCSELTDGWYKLATADGWICGEFVTVVSKTDDASQDASQKTDDFAERLVAVEKAIEDLRLSIKGNSSLIAGIMEQLDKLQGDD